MSAAVETERDRAKQPPVAPVRPALSAPGGAADRTRRRRRLVLALGAAFAASFAVNVAVLARHGRGSAPPVPGDTQDYENIAWNLLQGRGFGHDWDDPAWRAPYAAAKDPGMYDAILARRGAFAPTAYRPPALPLAIAATYAVFGRSFLAWGLVNAALAAAALALACGLALHLAGAGPAALTLALGLADTNFRAAAVLAPYLSEGLSGLAVVLLVWSLALLMERPDPLRFAGAGAALGLLPLVRGIFVFWYAPIALFVLRAALGRRGEALRRVAPMRFRRAALVGIGLFVAGALLVPLPWWIRNCAVLGGFYPLGTQGGRNLPLGYSDVAVEEGGVWTPEGTGRWWSQHEPAFVGLAPLDLEREQARFGQRKTLEWIRAHPAAVPGLALSKAADLWRRPLPGRFGLALALVALLAIAPAAARPGLGGAWAALAAETFAVSATYSDGVRFLVPVLPILHILVAIGLWRTIAAAAAALRTR